MSRAGTTPTTRLGVLGSTTIRHCLHGRAGPERGSDANYSWVIQNSGAEAS
jgi:hypothetical protein